MSAVEDTRDARERAHRLLGEIAVGNVRVAWTGKTILFIPVVGTLLRLDEVADQDAIWDLLHADLATMEPPARGADDAPNACPVALTDKGRAVLGVPPADPAPPPLLCDGVIHAQGEQPPAVVVCAETTGGMKRMVLCRDCGQRYALDAACLALAAFELYPSARPVAIHLIPLPQPGTGA